MGFVSSFSLQTYSVACIYFIYPLFFGIRLLHCPIVQATCPFPGECRAAVLGEGVSCVHSQGNAEGKVCPFTRECRVQGVSIHKWMPRVRCVQSQEMPRVRCVHSQEMPRERCVHSQEMLKVRCVHSQEMPSVRCVHSQKMLSVRCVHSQEMPSVRCVHSQELPSVRCVHSQEMPSVRCVHSQGNAEGNVSYASVQKGMSRGRCVLCVHSQGNAKWLSTQNVQKLLSAGYRKSTDSRRQCSQVFLKARLQLRDCTGFLHTNYPETYTKSCYRCSFHARTEWLLGKYTRTDQKNVTTDFHL